jgi:heat shock protein HslJ
MKLLSFLAALLLLASCGVKNKTSSTPIQKKETLLWIISDQQIDCVGITHQKCLVYQLKGENNWQNFYGKIEGFNPEIGYSYEIEVEASPVKNPAADASSLHYSLIRIISSQEVKNLASILNDSYGLIELYGEPIPRTTSMLIEFQARNNGLIIGNSGCNGFRGELTLLDSNSGALRLGPIAATEMFCDGKMELEINFFKALGEATHIQPIKGGMQLLNGKNVLLTAMRID